MSPSWNGNDRVRLALVVWAVAFLGIAVRVAFDRPGHRSVFAIYGKAAERWRQGIDLYPQEGTDPTFPLFRYSPPVAAVLTPFTIAPPSAAEIAWRLLTGGLLLAALVAWARTGLPQPLSATWQAILLLLVLPLTLSNWNNGQSNPLVLALLLAATVAVLHSRWNLAAGCLAIAGLFKVYPLALALLLVVLYPQRLLPRLALALGLGLALPFLFQEPSYVARQYVLWVDYLRQDDRSVGDLLLGNTDFQLLVRVWIGPLTISGYRIVQLSVGAGMALACLAARRAGWSEPRQLTLLLGMSCVWMTAFGPATESATYLFLAPIAAWAMLECGLTLRPQSLLVMAAYLLLLSVQLSGWIPGLIRPYNKLGPQPLAALLLLAGIGLASRRIFPGGIHGSNSRQHDPISQFVPQP